MIPIQEEFQCKGFYGFGAGVELHREGQQPGRAIYCGRSCPLSQECWTAHVQRIDSLIPDFAEFIHGLMEEGLKGQELAKRVYEETGTEPYSAVMAGNLEDGSRVAAGMDPKDRGEKFTLPYPFKES